MLAKRWGVIPIACGMLCAAGCATLADVRAGQGTGSIRTYNAPANLVWSKALQACGALGLRIASTEGERGLILAETGVTGFSWGENVAVFVKKIDDAHTKVEVVSKRRLATNITAYNYEPRVLSKLDELLSSTSQSQASPSNP